MSNVLAEIQRLIDPEASVADPVEPMEDGWATVYQSGNKLFQLFYIQDSGYESFEIGAIPKVHNNGLKDLLLRLDQKKLKVGSVKEKNGVRYFLNENHRWEKIGDRRSAVEENAEITKIAKQLLKRYKEDWSKEDAGSLLIKDGLTYNQILKERGKTAAEKALEESLKKAAIDRAQKKYKIKQVEEEEKRIERFGTPQEKEELVAISRLHLKPRDQTIAEWKTSNSKEAETLIGRYREAVRLDEALSYDQIMLRGSILAKSLKTDLTATVDEQNQFKIMDQFRDSLFESGLSREAAERIVSSKNFHSSLDQYPEAKSLTKLAATQFYQLSGGLGQKTIDSFIFSAGRAYANPEKRTVNIGSSPSREVLFHELGHHFEYEDGRIFAAAAQWRDKRASGAKTSMNSLTNSSGYDLDEEGVPDQYIHPYVGKVYLRPVTEVVSMGLERFASTQSMLDFYEKDPSHFEFILGVLRRD